MKVRKRDGRIAKFEQAKITEAIWKAVQAVGGRDRSITEKLSDQVVAIVNENFSDKVPTVEDIQDVVEKVLIENGHAKVAKSYILYREQHRRLRDMRAMLLDSEKIVSEYMSVNDWRVKENANIGYSFSGLLLHAAGSVMAYHVLNNLYPKEIANAHINGDFHLHDLSMSIAGYCAGWSLHQLLLEGFNGVPGRIESGPPKHFRSALGHIVNFFGTLQNEWAGAQAMSSFDTYLAPFIRQDNLSYGEIKQGIQEFVFSINVTSRWGGQCVSADTEVLTENGWKKYHELKGEKVATFNTRSKKIEFLAPQKVNIYDFDGEMINLKNRVQDQLLTPNHRVLRKKFNSGEYTFNDAQELMDFETPVLVPIAAESCATEEIPDEWVRLYAWLVSEGTLSDDRGRIALYQSIANEDNCDEIRTTLKCLDMTWHEISRVHGFSQIPSVRFRLNQRESEKVRETITSKEIPSFIKTLSPRQIKLFVNTYAKGDGHREQNGRVRLYTKSDIVKDQLQELCVLCGYGTTLKKNSNDVWVINLVRNDTTSITKIEKVLYKGKVWCPTTANGTFVARRDGKVFITGNSPFTNLTFDWVVPEDLAEENVIIGGELQDSKYKDYQKEMDMINRAFIEVLLEGDKNGRVFTFPIPTYNITKEFNWDSENTNLLFEMTARYGLPYFQNFVNSDLRPGDVRSMCCRLQLNLNELRKKTGGLFGSGESTGSIGVVTINMPRIGYLSSSEEEFFERLERLMYLAKESLELKRKIVERNLEEGLLPYTRRYLGTLKNHFSTIGLIGMNEAALNLIGKSITTSEGKAFAARTLLFMRDKLREYQEETGNIYNLEATPAEGTSYRLARIDKQKYPNIITAGEGEPYYTNSSLPPPHYTDDIFEALEHQDDLQMLYTGGCIEKGNKVLTNKGLLNIEHIVKNFEKLKPIKVVSFSPEKKVSEWDEIVDAVAIDVEKKNKIRVKGERNLNIVTSDWHPFFLLEKIKVNPTCPVCKEKVENVKGFAAHLRWSSKCKERYRIMPKYRVVEKRADELKINDFILQNSTNLHSEKETELNEDLMWLIGFFIGDGCISEFIDNRGGNNLKKYKIRFFSEHQKSLERVEAILSKYFQTKVSVIKNDKRSKSLKEVSTSKKEIPEFFFKYGFSPGKKVYSVSIPQKVKENITRTNLFSLLAGLVDSDGTVNKRDGDIEYYTVSAKLAEDILEICTIGGILINKREKPTKRKNEVNGWRLVIPSYEATKLKDKLNITVNTFRIKKCLSNRKKRQLSVTRVREVSKVDVEDNKFYDLMTKNNHNYLAGKNSLVFVHNTVLHGFLGEKISSGEACKKLVKTIAENFRLPYFTITPTFSVCRNHGYLGGEQFKCPSCGEDTEVYSRVVGYFRPVQNWNAGKREEFKDRLEYDITKAMAKTESTQNAALPAASEA
ncbi:MAG: ribonucleoside triphosphate reductase [Candidatus Aenigmarchaeota archaeon]|nr:ribonucleoside triphosphate reductase [Candidatus Aenigmarchaeota archaeon]